MVAGGFPKILRFRQKSADIEGMSQNINVREGGEQRRHEERMAAMERDATIREKELEIREKELAINVRRDWRERVLLWIAGISCAVSLVSLWIAGLAIKVAAMPK